MKARLKPLGEQVMVVTGATSGIGLLIARSAAKRGARLFLIARNRQMLAKVVRDIRAEGGVADFAVADVADEAAVDAAAMQAIACFGRIDSWVNNAGVAIYAKLLDTPDDEHVRLFATNYFGIVHGCRAAVRHMRERGGALISVASIAADMPSPILGAYAASKHAVKAYLESLRIELQADDVPIAVSIVKPSGMATNIGAHAANHMDAEALVPPPAYDPQLTADAVLACAQSGQREVTVGGFGRAQAMFAVHFPALFERLAPMVIPLLSTRRMPKTAGDALFEPGNDGQARSSKESGIARSPYTTFALHPAVTRGLMAIATSAALLAISRAKTVRRGR